MYLTKHLFGILLAGSLLAGGMGAHAALIPAVGDLDIDFRTTDWASAAGQKQHTHDGVNAEAFPDYFEIPLCLPIVGCVGTLPISEAELSQNGTDGLGNKHSVGGEIDELDNRLFHESILISFYDPWKLEAAWLTNLFPDEIRIKDTCIRPGRFFCREWSYTYEDEIGGYSADGGSDILFVALNDDGTLRLDLGNMMPSTIEFFVPTGEIKSFESDFSIAGFEGMKVPTPSTLALFSLGLTVLGYVRIKKKHQSLRHS